MYSVTFSPSSGNNRVIVASGGGDDLAAIWSISLDSNECGAAAITPHHSLAGTTLASDVLTT